MIAEKNPLTFFQKNLSSFIGAENGITSKKVLLFCKPFRIL